MMNKNDLIKLGSKTAKRGFRNEDDVKNKFNDWKNDSDAQIWLKKMGYSINKIERVEAIKVTGSFKTDVQVQVTIYFKNVISAENLSIKLISNPTGFNQIDKRWIDKYTKLWSIPENITFVLKKFTGEISPEPNSNLLDSRRMFLTEFDKNTQNLIVNFFEKNRTLIISDILKGRGRLSANWMLVAFKNSENNKWVLKSINEAMNIFNQGEVKITKRGSLKIGRITMQRKGGDGGRKSANMLQFKINPAELFDF